MSKDSKIYEPEMLKDKPIAVTPNNGSDFTTLKMMEGFLEPKHVKRTNIGSMLKRLEAVRDGRVAAASLMEPWSAWRRSGACASSSSRTPRAEAAGDELTDPRSRNVQRAGTRGRGDREEPAEVRALPRARDRRLLEPEELQTWRLLHAAPQPYTRERWEDTYNWTVKWGEDTSRRHLREHRRQPRLAITKET